MKKDNLMGFCQQQLSNSLNDLAIVKSAMVASENSVRAAAHEWESCHAQNDNEKKQLLESEIEAEEITCKEKLRQICGKWKDLLSCKAPQELSQHVSEQCKACDGLLESKKHIIEIIHAELKSADEEYYRMFRQQAKDVDTLINSMGSQVVNLHNSFIQELSNIEDDFLSQRKDLMMRNKAEIDTLMKKVRISETSIKDNLTKRMDDYVKTLDQIRTQDNEDYNLLKVRLETDIQTLEQHLASMEAAYQLNSEKLDYNYAVLVERDHDNYVTAGQQKRKLTKQRDTLCTLKARHNDSERRFLFHNGKLATDYEKVIRLLQDLQSKEQEIQAAQEKQHWEFLYMHHNSLTVLASKLLQADKIIREQQLGWLWHPPCKQIFSFLSPSFSSIKGPLEKSENGQSDDQSTEGENGSNVLAKSSLKHLRNYSENKLPKISEIENLWRSYNNMIAPKVLHVWAAFGVALMAYNQLLKQRGKLMHQVHYLSQEREALHMALERCTSSKVEVQKIVS